MGQGQRVSKKLLIHCPSEVLVHSQQQDRNKWQKLHQGGRTRIILGKWVELNREQRNIWLETRSQESEEKAEGREEITLQFLCQHLPNAGTWGRAGRSQWPKENTEGRGGRDWLDQGDNNVHVKGKWLWQSTGTDLGPDDKEVRPKYKKWEEAADISGWDLEYHVPLKKKTCQDWRHKKKL